MWSTTGLNIRTIALPYLHQIINKLTCTAVSLLQVATIDIIIILMSMVANLRPDSRCQFKISNNSSMYKPCIHKIAQNSTKRKVIFQRGASPNGEYATGADYFRCCHVIDKLRLRRAKLFSAA